MNKVLLGRTDMMKTDMRLYAARIGFALFCILYRSHVVTLIVEAMTQCLLPPTR